MVALCPLLMQEHALTVQIEWANFRNTSMLLETLKVHELSEHAVVPVLGGDIIVVVAPALKVRCLYLKRTISLR
jgi:hypothetical protein